MKKFLTVVGLVTLCSCGIATPEASSTKEADTARNDAAKKITYTQFAKCKGSSGKGTVDVSLLSMDSDSNAGLIKIEYFPKVNFPDEGGMDSAVRTRYSLASLEVFGESLMISGNMFQIDFALVDDEDEFLTKVVVDGVLVAEKLTCSL